MGATREWKFSSGEVITNDKPVHKVSLTRPFYIGKHPVTQAQWQAVMGSNPSHFKGAENPVEMVSWEDAQAFLQKLNQKENTMHYRLPTEAEWEYAARAGTKTEFFWGEDEKKLGEYAWFRENSGNRTHPVGTKIANPWGLHDVYGNVYEWVADWYGAYSAAACQDPRGPASGLRRTWRGGSWFNDARFCRSARRGSNAPVLRYDNLGLRLALAPDFP